MTLSLAFITTYPTTQCGIATFSRSLRTHVVGVGARVGVVRVVPEGEGRDRQGRPPEIGRDRQGRPGLDLRSEPVLAPEVVHEWTSGSAGAAAAAAAVNDHDVAVVQHEYGIFAGDHGDSVLDLLAEVDIPVVTVLHTVVDVPTARQRLILESLADRSDVLVTLSRSSRERLLRRYDVDPRRVEVVPHGAPAPAPRSAAPVDRPTVLTWGLLGPGKGIEWGIAAMSMLDGVLPDGHAGRPRYRVVGQTHPRVLERDGTAYQDMLADLVRDLGLEDDVTFDHHYAAPDALRAEVAAADVVLLPYDSLDQVTSGVLIEAVAAGRPVVATRFPHAEELLATGAGLTVPHRDPAATARAIGRVLVEPGLARRMSDEAGRLAPDLLWPAVAARFVDVAATAASRPARSLS